MRTGIPLTVGLCAAVVLAGCSKPSAPSGTPAADTRNSAPAAAAPPALIDADKTALLAPLPPAYRGADLENGQSKLALCKACHTFGQGGEAGVGPNLWGVFGRKAGGLPGFSYSDGMKALGVVWDADRINTWITKPSAMVPGTKMTYAGIENAKDRVDLIAALKVATSGPAR
jgi:cytochrome c